MNMLSIQINRSVTLLLAVCCLLTTLSAELKAHYIWVYHEDGKIKVVFGEELEPDEARFLTGLKPMTVFSDGEQSTELSLTQKSDGDQGWFETTFEAAGPAIKLNCPYGVFRRGEKSMWLDYSARYVQLPTASHLKADANLTLDVIPTWRDGALELTTTFEGKPAANVELTITPQVGATIETKSNEVGAITVPLPARYRIMAKKVVAEAGEIDGQKFDEQRFFCTVVIDLTAAETAAHKPGDTKPVAEKPATDPRPSLPTASRFGLKRSELELPDFPRALTSFGAATIDGQFYIVGGKEGKAHAYAKSYQNRNLYRLKSQHGESSEWETVSECDGLQGVSLVAHAGKLYRIGGMEARNAEGAEHDLHSVADFVCFNPADGSWKKLADLPAGRSSIDACVVGDIVYVVGGWTMTGNEDSQWCDDMLSFDLSNSAGEWKSIPVPFSTRAMAAREHAGKLLAIGGIQQQGGPTDAVHIFDPASRKWSAGPVVPSDSPMKAFGCSAIKLGDHLLLSGYDGRVFRLSDDWQNWELVGELGVGRFFHQMLPISETSFAVVGGANMEDGSLQEIEVYEMHQRN